MNQIRTEATMDAHDAKMARKRAARRLHARSGPVYTRATLEPSWYRDERKPPQPFRIMAAFGWLQSQLDEIAKRRKVREAA